LGRFQQPFFTFSRLPVFLSLSCSFFHLSFCGSCLCFALCITNPRPSNCKDSPKSLWMVSFFFSFFNACSVFQPSFQTSFHLGCAHVSAPQILRYRWRSSLPTCDSSDPSNFLFFSIRNNHVQSFRSAIELHHSPPFPRAPLPLPAHYQRVRLTVFRAYRYPLRPRPSPPHVYRD